MNKLFYLRLAITNIRKNKSIYLPYLFAGTLIIMLFYSLSSVSIMAHDTGSTLSAILAISNLVCGILSIMFLFYINSFIIKRRKKEFGLYSILGMEKRHISLVMFFEVLITVLISILLGIGGGALFSQLCFLILLKLIGLPAQLVFQIPLDSVALSFTVFGGVFLLVFLYDVVSIMRTDPIGLLQSDKQGEREPKSKWLLTLAGILTLGAGYGIALTVKTSGEALQMFFFAVLLVIAGTYFLFTAGSIVFLKLLRKNKSFYYRAQNFISVSGMLYRMKQNAAGLSNICILSTCVLVTLSSTVCLFLGQEDVLLRQFYRQVYVTSTAQDQDPAVIHTAVQSHAQEHGFTVENAVGHYTLLFAGGRSGDSFTAQGNYTAATYDITVLMLEDYNRILGTEYVLDQGETLLYLNGDALSAGSFRIATTDYTVKDSIPLPFFADGTTGRRTVVAVLSDLDALKRLTKDMNDSTQSAAFDYKIAYTYRFDAKGDAANLPEYYATMRDSLNQTVEHLATVDNIDAARESYYEAFGSLMFVGIFFVALFLVATVLIIYYKQITEGFDDRARFQILRKVGMSDKEVKSTIQRQVLMVFFLPLGFALLHIAVAFRVLLILLAAFQMTNTLLFLICTILAALVFAVFYYAVYQLTARTYYRILQSAD